LHEIEKINSGDERGAACLFQKGKKKKVKEKKKIQSWRVEPGCLFKKNGKEKGKRKKKKS
jgi:hypothetical protein